MPISETLPCTLFRLLVLAGACLCVCGTPVYLPHRQNSLDSPQDGALVAMSGSGALVRVTDPLEDEGSAGGGGGGGGGGGRGGGGGGGSDGPDARRARPGEARSRRNGDIFPGGRSGPGPDGGGGEAARGRERREAEAEEAQTSESPAEPADDQSRPTPDAALSADHERRTPVLSATEGNATVTAATGAPPQADPQRSAAWEKETASGGPSSQESPGASAGGQRPLILGPVSSALAPSLGASPFPALSEWGGQDGATAPFVPDLLLAEVGPDVMPKPEGPEGLWSEAARESEVDTEVPLSQDQSTEGTMSSKALPLIFEPFDDVKPQGAATAAAAGVTAAATPGGPQPPIAAKATVGTFPSEAAFDRLVTVETDGDGPSHPPPMLMPEWTSPWQTSGTELEPSTSPDPSAPQPGPSERQTMKDSDKMAKLEEASSVSVLPASSLLSSGKPVTEATHRHVSKSTSGLEEMESEEEPDEDEEDENTEESDEDDEEDEEQTEMPASTRPPYSLIPPPPIWVQHNHGLMRSWMELIREKAGYVSGMLAPVGIGIAGAILIVGALYSIRMIHRRRRNSFKYQRRKVRQQEQPREIGPSRPDQAMLLADSSEDEF